MNSNGARDARFTIDTKKKSNGARDTRFTIDKKRILRVREILA